HLEGNARIGPHGAWLASCKIERTPRAAGRSSVAGKRNSARPQACEVQPSLASGWSGKSLRQASMALATQDSAAIAARGRNFRFDAPVALLWAPRGGSPLPQTVANGMVGLAGDARMPARHAGKLELR